MKTWAIVVIKHVTCLRGSYLPMRLSLPRKLLADVQFGKGLPFWNACVRAGVPSATLGHEVAWEGWQGCHVLRMAELCPKCHLQAASC